VNYSDYLQGFSFQQAFVTEALFTGLLVKTVLSVGAGSSPLNELAIG